MLKTWNTNAISMVPKVDRPAKIKEYRPLASCTVHYKCITKILANRSQVVLPFHVSLIKISLLS